MRSFRHVGPGSEVRVYLGPANDASKIAGGGQTTADATGVWTHDDPALARGRYRGIAMAFLPSSRTRPGLTIVPMTPLGRITISPPPPAGEARIAVEPELAVPRPSAPRDGAR